ncbi:cuticle protein AMP1A-like [Macrobrachium nipponense]|uniref:cuticle protein AMP1A-like n=1 Tax=Macrobrachium nipponense TaxID=159736 RepID=UPI0030C80B67
MKFVIIAALATVALAAPQYSYDAPAGRSSADSSEEVAILRDERVHEDDGKYNFDFESENGIRFSEAGSPDGDEDAIVSAGQYSYTAPDGTEVVVKYVANENGFQPQSDLLPVAPEFPHPPNFPSSCWTRSPSLLRKTPAVPVMALVRLPSRSYGAPSNLL